MDFPDVRTDTQLAPGKVLFHCGQVDHALICSARAAPA
jgi:hypothetical protein